MKHSGVKRFTLRLIFTGAAVFISILTNSVWAQDQPPVWKLKVEQDIPSVVENKFSESSYGKEFPIDHVRLKKAVNVLIPGISHPTPDSRLYISPLNVSLDGTLSTNSAVTWFSDNQLNRNEDFGAYSVLTRVIASGGDPNGPLASFPKTYVDLIDIRSQQLPIWELSPDGGLAVVHTNDPENLSNQRTFFIDSKTGRRVMSYDSRTSNVVFSKDGQIIAAVAIKDDQRRIVVFNAQGDLQLEGLPSRHDYDFFSFSSSGDFLTYVEKRRGGEQNSFALHLATGEIRTLDLPAHDGRYYSQDGRLMLLIQPRGIEGIRGKAFLYSVEDPFNPLRLWEFSADTPILTASLNPDGSLIALQVGESVTPGLRYHVILLDNQGNIVGRPVTSTLMQGLQFEEEFLFVGTQRHPLPVGIHRETTKEINIYDLSNFAAGGR